MNKMIVIKSVCVFGFLMIFGCDRKSPKNVDARFHEVEDALGKPVQVESMSNLLDKVHFYQCAEFNKRKPTDAVLQRALNGWNMVDTKRDELIPFLWMNTSLWEDFARRSKNTDRVRNAILKDDIRRSTFFFKRDGVGLSRLVFHDVDGSSTVVLMEILKE